MGAKAKAKWRQRQSTMAQPLTIPWCEGRLGAKAKAKWRQRQSTMAQPLTIPLCEGRLEAKAKANATAKRNVAPPPDFTRTPCRHRRQKANTNEQCDTPMPLGTQYPLCACAQCIRQSLVNKHKPRQDRAEKNDNRDTPTPANAKAKTQVEGKDIVEAHATVKPTPFHGGKVGRRQRQSPS